MAHAPDCESFCSRCPIYRAADRKAGNGGTCSLPRRCRRWHSRLSYPTPKRLGEAHHRRSHHLWRGLAWTMAVRAFLLAPPPWDSQVDPATCFLYTPLCLVLESSNRNHITLTSDRKILSIIIISYIHVLFAIKFYMSKFF